MSEAIANATAQRIRARWGAASSGQRMNPGPRIRNNGGEGGSSFTRLPGGRNLPIYSGSDITNTTSDFIGDWRSADSWMRYDLLRVRARSRQLGRGNKWVKAFYRALINNVLGHNGFNFNPNVIRSKEFGDTKLGIDSEAEAMILAAYERFGKAKNFETRKRMNRREFQEFIVRKWAEDGEVFIRKIKGFDNEFGFSWQLIDPDYCDHNLNRIEAQPGPREGAGIGREGDITKMGVRLDKDYKFPVSYFFLYRRPNDYFYNYATIENNRYYEVPADEVIHIFTQDLDSEQTRGWPLVFSASVNLFRAEKWEEASVVNAAIGASKMGFFEKEFPDGFTEDPDALDDEGNIIDYSQPGVTQELPYGVKFKPWDPKYPDQEFAAFQNAILGGAAASLGCSRVELTGDLTGANYSSMRAGSDQQNETWKNLQLFFIERWCIPANEEEIYRQILSGQLKLPMAKLEKFTRGLFRGRRWPYVNPVDDQKAADARIAARLTSPSHEIRNQGGDPEEVWQQIARDKKRMTELDILPQVEVLPEPTPQPIPPEPAAK